MQHSHRLPHASDPLPPRFVSLLAGFLDLFTRPTWPNVLVLLAGVVLAPGRRTVTTALRILGRDRDPDFCTFHRILRPVDLPAILGPGDAAAGCEALRARGLPQCGLAWRASGHHGAAVGRKPSGSAQICQAKRRTECF